MLQHLLIVGEGGEFHSCFLEPFSSDRKPVGEDGHHAYDIASILCRASTAFRLLWPVDTRSSTTTTFWLGLRSPSITFSNPWSLGAEHYIHERFAQLFCYQRTLSYGACGHPAITSTSSYLSAMMLAICILMKVRISGYDSVLRLSQYMGDFQPDAQVNGFSGCTFIAFIFSSFSATNLSNCFIS